VRELLNERKVELQRIVTSEHGKVPDDALGEVTRGIEVVLANGRSLRVGPGFDADTLVKLVDLLEAGGVSC